MTPRDTGRTASPTRNARSLRDTAHAWAGALSLALLLALPPPVLAQPALPSDWAAALNARDAARLGALARDAGGRLPRGRYGMTPLHTAAAVDCLPCVDALLAAGASPALRRDDGGTPLHRAPAAVRQRLIAAGADVTVRDDLGRTPLMTSVEPGPDLLLAGVDSVDRHGFTALHWAALAGAHDSVAWLLAQGADPRLRSTARYEHREGVLAAEFDPVIPFDPGQRALDLARFQYDRTKWATSRYTRTKEMLDAATPADPGGWLRGLIGR
jgi:Ankyrin repeats (3 copies)/Ankyrin repeats (many copies)